MCQPKQRDTRTPEERDRDPHRDGFYRNDDYPSGGNDPRVSKPWWL